MAEIAQSFDDSTAYERFMGRWSRAVGPVFLDWLVPPARARWLEVGCGTGIFTELILDNCSPETVVAVDPAKAQIDHACRQPAALRANFQIADARDLPFADSEFDVVASALVINFIPDRPKALSEMRRVAQAGGMVAGYVWDFAADRSPSWPLRAGMQRVGMGVPGVTGGGETSLGALGSLFEQAGLEAISSRSIEVTQSYADFEDFWQAQTPSYNPVTKVIAAASEAERERLKATVRAGLAVNHDGRIEYSARGHAIKGRVPG